MKHMFWLLVALVVTVWQVHAGIQRCGTIDGGVLLAPLAIGTWMLLRGVSQDLRAAFRETSPESEVGQ